MKESSVFSSKGSSEQLSGDQFAFPGYIIILVFFDVTHFLHITFLLFLWLGQKEWRIGGRGKVGWLLATDRFVHKPPPSTLTLTYQPTNLPSQFLLTYLPMRFYRFVHKALPTTLTLTYLYQPTQLPTYLPCAYLPTCVLAALPPS